MCDKDCQASLPILTSDPVTGQLILTDPVSGNTTVLLPSDIPGFQGTVVCARDTDRPTNDTVVSTGCKLLSISLKPSGFEGTYGVGSVVESAVANSVARRLARFANVPLMRNLHEDVNGRLLALFSSNGTNVTVPSPVICLELGQGLLFSLPDGKTSYPVYVKDSLLNTNPDFDYGEFRKLGEVATSSSGEVRLSLR